MEKSVIRVVIYYKSEIDLGPLKSMWCDVVWLSQSGGLIHWTDNSKYEMHGFFSTCY